jgi:hypothetical protein
MSLGGRTGFWDYRDHDVFLKIWSQNLPAHITSDALTEDKRKHLLNKLMPMLPGNGRLAFYYKYI